MLEKLVELTEQPKVQAPIETMVDADDMEMTEAFRVLCLPPHATAYEVKRAYRKAALAVHPDKPGGSARLFRRTVVARRHPGSETTAAGGASVTAMASVTFAASDRSAWTLRRTRRNRRHCSSSAP